MVLTVHCLSWLTEPKSHQWSLFTLSAAFIDFRVTLSIINYTPRQLRPLVKTVLNAKKSIFKDPDSVCWCNSYMPGIVLVVELLVYICSLPMTLLAKEVRIRVASPKSPILTEPVGPVMKMLSHLRSRWTIGGVLVWRKWRPFRICLHQLLRTLGFITLKRFR